MPSEKTTDDVLRSLQMRAASVADLDGQQPMKHSGGGTKFARTNAVVSPANRRRIALDCNHPFGQGDPLDMTNPLYVRMVVEIRKRASACQSDVAVGDLWPTRVLTQLILRREETTLPAWTKTGFESFEWRES